MRGEGLSCYSLEKKNSTDLTRQNHLIFYRTFHTSSSPPKPPSAVRATSPVPSSPLVSLLASRKSSRAASTLSNCRLRGSCSRYDHYETSRADLRGVCVEGLNIQMFFSARRIIELLRKYSSRAMLGDGNTRDITCCMLIPTQSTPTKSW